MSNFLHKCNGNCKLYMVLMIAILGLLLYQCYYKEMFAELSELQIELIIDAATQGVEPSPSQLEALSPEQLVIIQTELNKFYKN